MFKKKPINLKKIIPIAAPTPKSKYKGVNGKIHSIETFGTLDGPGIRTVIFFEGCMLRCIYCHNVDMLDMKSFIEYTPRELVNKILPYKEYFDTSSGGVTVSGGDPFFQPKFLVEFLKECKKEGIHTCVDTSLCTARKNIDEVLPYADMFMVSLKHFDNKMHQKLTMVPNTRILENIRHLSKKKVRLWLRYVVLPGFTDTRSNLKALIKFCNEINFELIELLPYHEFGVYKWEELKLDYQLKKTRPPKWAKVFSIKKKLEDEGFRVLLNE
ncbi:pyruvate formate lyase-activating protein [Patescibacteria group bacterium]|nr:pyruvate formate lyase-activating protein [Patescibacteria group bacterium]